MYIVPMAWVFIPFPFPCKNKDKISIISKITLVLYRLKSTYCTWLQSLTYLQSPKMALLIYFISLALLSFHYHSLHILLLVLIKNLYREWEIILQ